MKKKLVMLTLVGMAAGFALACINVNIYFPEATVKKAAEEIVDEIRKTDGEPAKKQTACFENRGFSLVTMAYAQEETSVSNPAIRSLKDSMKNRFPSLKPFFEGGNIGENNKGFLDVRDEASLNLKDKAALRNMVKDENADRTKLYTEVTKALNIEAAQVERIQKIFATNWVKSASTGWWIQQDNGAWVKKS